MRFHSFLFAILIFFIFFAGGCSEDNNKKAITKANEPTASLKIDSRLIGIWEGVPPGKNSSDFLATVIFKSNGTYEFTTKTETGTSGTNGTWSADGVNITFYNINHWHEIIKKL